MRGTYDFISWLLLLTWAAAAKKSRATKNEIRSEDKKISSQKKTAQYFVFGPLVCLHIFNSFMRKMRQKVNSCRLLPN